jgi:chromatin remodeling complex protein RSC6
MVKATKTSTKTTASSGAEIAAPVEKKVVESTPTASSEIPVVQKKTKKEKAKKEVVEAVAVADAVAPLSTDATVVVAVAAEAQPDATLPTNLLADNSIVILLGELAALDQQEVSIQQQRRIKRKLLEKAIIKVLKANNKATTKKQKRSGNRQPSGFIRPTLISDELAVFLGKESGTEMARTAVTNQINAYIKENNLKDAKNGRQINADAKLSALLKLEKDDVLTYFNLQKFMKYHFVKTPAVAAPVV